MVVVMYFRYVFFLLKNTSGTKKREVIHGCTRKCCAGAHLSKHRTIRGDRYVISFKTMPFGVGNVFIYAFLFVLVNKIVMFNSITHKESNK